mmetsp:Transcript_72281/g.160667  ORF Transcript_72281/g.160667 Transcript_72281/m.160667 type:complete len:104 (+) Transcript_72281:360-671(+)
MIGIAIMAQTSHTYLRGRLLLGGLRPCISGSCRCDRFVSPNGCDILKMDISLSTLLMFEKGLFHVLELLDLLFVSLLVLLLEPSQLLIMLAQFVERLDLSVDF